MKNPVLLCVSVLVFGLAGQSFAAPPASSTFAFLRIEPDARSMGMAGAVTSYADDVFTSYWNPAAISRVPGLNLGVSHVFWFSDLNADFLSASWSFPRVGAFAVSLSGLYPSSTAEALDAVGNPSALSTASGFFSAGLSYAIQPYLIRMGVTGAKLYFGGTARFITERLSSYSKSSVAFDLAFFGDSIFIEDVNFSLVLRNMGPSVAWRGAPGVENLPFEYTAGFSYTYTSLARNRDSLKITPAIEFTALNDYKPILRLGAEAEWFSLRQNLGFSLRIGYLTPQDRVSRNGIRAGLGVRYKHINVDYAFAFHDPLDNVHRLTVRYSVPMSP